MACKSPPPARGARGASGGAQPTPPPPPRLAPEVEASYTAIIDGILAESDLDTISAKRLRKGLQQKLGHSISHQKDEVTALILACFDKANSARGRMSDESELSELGDTPPRKRQKRHKARDDAQDKSASVDDDDAAYEDDDAAYAAKLQAEFNAASRARPTRGANTKKRAPQPKKKREKKKKSATRVKDEDDSDVQSGSGAEKKEVKRTGGFHKPLGLSEPLQAMLGETTLSRPQCVKKIWDYVKARNLQDPSDKRQIVCDDAMRAVFKQDRVHMFTLNKILSQNLFSLDDAA